ncbi:hypothetical protein HU230_0029650 [Bradyrhizobium quebecense]|uniref:Uncharacterized protein n=1 Tax=Bradyrhizobium quebecense TaxID=2748629 RepID=A0A973WHT9_9BRAD|nr:hypothetical protein [Bradyrhizobium quebecense]UGA42437.1 hypothetical protein HU230_0029650 [Bradyrhizobium quebecense]
MDDHANVWNVWAHAERTCADDPPGVASNWLFRAIPDLAGFSREMGVQLRWGRGFFRAWIVISVLWIGLAVMIAKPEAYPALWHRTKYTVTSPTGQQITVDASMTRDQLTQTLDAGIQQEKVRSGHKVEAGTREAILNHIDTMLEAGDRALQVWLITIIPPVALLLLGIAIGWIIGGFQKDKSQPA